MSGSTGTPGSPTSWAHGFEHLRPGSGLSYQIRQISSRRMPPFPGNPGHYSSHSPRHGRGPSGTVSGEEPSIDSVKAFLNTHTEVLEDYLMEHTTMQQLDFWLRKKKTADSSQKDRTESVVSLSKPPVIQERYTTTDISMLRNFLVNNMHVNPLENLSILYELANIIGTAISSDGIAIHAVQNGEHELYLYVPPTDDCDSHLHLSGPVAYQTTVAAHVAMTKEAVLVKDLVGDDRFPKGIGVDGSLMQSVLCAPFLHSGDDLLCVMEFTRNWDKKPFSDIELQTVTSYVAWAGMAYHMFKMNQVLSKQAELNCYLLEVSKMIFDDVVEIDLLVKKIMTYTKDLVQADRCALFLLDEDRKELYANLFDDGDESDGKRVFTKREIRFSMEKGIAGHVARTGEIINIPDAYSDVRFNREIDMITGYTTKNILCMPIISKGCVIGVVQMVNKINGNCFTLADERAFNLFAVYCALSLHYSKMYCESQLRSAQYNVALEMISYHACCSEDEYSQFTEHPYPKVVPPELNSFYFYGPQKHESELHNLVVVMCDNLFGVESFDRRKLCRFLLTVKKNYRPVAYHNWKHGFNVAHCMYCILIRLKERNIIPELRMKALLVASLCHDLDHRGYNNSYFTKFDEPLATLYPSSVMEQHHYSMTVNILQESDQNIFYDLNAADYKQVLDYMKHAIIATDLALYFGNQKTLAKYVASGTVNLEDPGVMSDVLSLAMTGSDLSAIVKPWATQQNTVKYIYEEFYMQGDEEKQKGVTPIAMMDRENKDNLPKDQVGFIKFICLPCYQTLADIFPETTDLMEGCKDNLQQWQRVVEGRSTKVWEPAKSIPN